MKKPTKSHKIRQLLAKGKSVKEIAKTTGASASYIYTVKSQMTRAIPVVGDPRDAALAGRPSTWLDKVISKIVFWR